MCNYHLRAAHTCYLQTLNFYKDCLDLTATTATTTTATTTTTTGIMMIIITSRMAITLMTSEQASELASQSDRGETNKRRGVQVNGQNIPRQERETLGFPYAKSCNKIKLNKKTSLTV